MKWDYLGRVPYQQAWEYQHQLREKRIQGLIDDTLLLLEHPPTITLGRLRGEKSLLHTQKELNNKGIEVIRSNRGGDATLHAPGQLVGYFIFNLLENGFKLTEFVETLAHIFCTLLEELGIQAHYDSKYPGVWVGTNKIVAFGFHLKENVTMHGFAFNIATTLDFFQSIIPCGLSQRGVTSLQQEKPALQTNLRAMSEMFVQIADEHLPCELTHDQSWKNFVE